MTDIISTSPITIRRPSFPSLRFPKLGIGDALAAILRDVDANGLPLHLGLSPGEAHDNRLCPVVLAGLQPKTTVLADRGL
jgi:hypothetical protein